MPNQVTPLEWDLRDKNHTFQKGHRIMVQVQSTLVPAHRPQPAPVHGHLQGEAEATSARRRSACTARRRSRRTSSCR